jgi:hypothetical protein
LKKKLIRLIKWPKARLEDILIIPCIKRRIRRIAIRDYQMGEHKKPFSPIQRCTYKSIVGTIFRDSRLRDESEHNVIPLLSD